MVETVNDLCQPLMFTTTFPAKPGSSFFFSLDVTANMKVIKTQSDPNPCYFPVGSLGGEF